MTSRRARRGAATFVLCLSLAAVLAATGCSTFGGPVQKSAAAEDNLAQDGGQDGEKQPRDAPPVVMILGDSYTVGDGRPHPEGTYASATARLLGWQVVVGGRSGTGFVMKRNGEAFLALFEGQLGWRPAPDMFIVSGGHNDSRSDPAQVAAAAHVLLERAGQRWPGTHIVLMGPIWGTGTPTRGAIAVRDALKDLAGKLGIPFIDPIGERWITGDTATGQGNAARYIKRDRTHPTEAGHRYLATRLARDLRQMGLAQPARNG